MISAKVVLDSGGRIAHFEAEGHAGHGAVGQDIVCAAFSVLARSSYEALAALPGCDIQGEAPKAGILRYSVRCVDPAQSGRAQGVADFLLAGISGLEREYPGEVGLTIERYWRE